MLILGLDPGSLHTGYGLVEKRGSSLEAVASGRFSCPPRLPLPQRLAFLSAELARLVEEFAPETAVMESLFQGLNPRSLIVLAQARGALLAVLASRGLEVREYSPAEVKTAVTGNGRADKEQVSSMVRLLLRLGGDRLSRDATDALAVAICCAHRLRLDRLGETVRATPDGP